MSRTDQDELGKILRSIRYFPSLTHALKSKSAGIMLSQLIYWDRTGHRADGYFSKTVRQLQNETGLTKSEQLKAQKLLYDNCLIDIKLAGNPAKRCFKVDIEEVHILLTSWLKSEQLDVLKASILKAEKLPAYIDSTQDNIFNSINREVVRTVGGPDDDLEADYTADITILKQLDRKPRTFIDVDP